jgi:CTP:molybdopterin cytidylyltransferase MocA
LAHRDADGVPALRRIVQSAWAGGAMPIVVVSHPGPAAEALRELLAGLPASLLLPDDVPAGSAWFGLGLDAAVAEVRETAAALLWPCVYAWVDPETVTSLIEAFGAAPSAIGQASFHGRAGLPFVVPVAHMERFKAEPTLHAQELVEILGREGNAKGAVELGDPGIIYDITVPLAEMPHYQGPPQPASGPPPEWNEDLGRHAESAPDTAAEPAREPQVRPEP